MHSNKLLILIFALSLQLTALAQKISGTVMSDKGELLPFASVLVKGSTKGVTANNDARFELNLEPGKYTLVCQHIGFTSSEKEITVKQNMNLDFILNSQHLLLQEVIIDNNAENPAYEIIRQAIKKRNFYNNQVRGFDCDLYSKDLIKMNSMPDKIFGKKIPAEDKRSMQLDSNGKGIIYLSEAISKIYSAPPDKFKMEVKSSRVSGSKGFGFTFPVFINMYTNLVSIFDGSIGQRGFVSPISDNAIHYYKFRMMGTFEENGKTVNTIKVTPRRKYEPLFSGVINITEDDWRIHSFDLQLTKESQIELLDTLRITQLHVPAIEDVWRVKNQLIHFNFKIFKVDMSGNFLSVYSDYHINPVFDKKLFDRVVIKYDTAVSKKTLTYWDSVRPVPLETEELKDYRLKDSLLQVSLDSANRNNNNDSLRKHQGKLKMLGFLWGGVHRTYYGKKARIPWNAEALLSNLSFNTAEGIVSQFNANFTKSFPKLKSRLTISSNIRYGFENHRLNPSLALNWNTRETDENFNLKRTYWKIAGGRRVSQYNNQNPVTPLINSFSTLLSGRNYMKTYENGFASLSFKKVYESGISFSMNATYEDRLPLYNTTNYTFKKKDTVNLTENYPVERVTLSDIYPHQSLQASVKISIKPGQRYIQFPNSKIPVGSKYPTFTLQYTKGFSDLLGSDVDFDKWKAEVYDNVKLRLAGELDYRFTFGGFANNNKVMIQDYYHLNSNNIGANLGQNNFRLLGSYVRSNTSSFYSEQHIEYHLNGFITNKLPVLKKKNWNLVAAAHQFMIDSKDYYLEYSVGLENIFKILRVDFVTAINNGKYQNSSIVLGTGGVLGSGINSNGSNNASAQISF